MLQVGGSLEQNGPHTVSFSREKQMIVEDEEKLCLAPTIKPFELISIVSRKGLNLLPKLNAIGTLSQNAFGFHSSTI